MDPDPDPRKEIEVDPDPDLDQERGFKWIRIRPNVVHPGGSGSATLVFSLKIAIFPNPRFKGTQAKDIRQLLNYNLSFRLSKLINASQLQIPNSSAIGKNFIHKIEGHSNGFEPRLALPVTSMSKLSCT